MSKKAQFVSKLSQKAGAFAIILLMICKSILQQSILRCRMKEETL